MSPQPREHDATAPGGARGGPGRRTVLAGLAGILLVPAGCSGDDGPGGRGGTAPPDPDAELVAEVVAEKRRLAAAHEATEAAFGSLGEVLAPMRADHRAHLRELGADPAELASASPSPGAAAGPDSAAGSVPEGRRDALRALARAERSAARARIEQCTRADDADLARLLAAIGGCEAAHRVLLDREADS